MSHESYSNAYLLRILNSVRSIAMVGASSKWNRPSYFAMKYLQEKGYRVIPVNPRLAGTTLLGETCYARLGEIPEPIDMVDIFRASHEAAAIVEEAVANKNAKEIGVIWMQLGVVNAEAAASAESAGLDVVMNRCPKIEFGRLHAELAWGGFNTGVITSKRRRVPS